jgi:Ribonuclease III
LTDPRNAALVEKLSKIIRDRKLAQFGDSLLNFSYSLAVTRTTRQPVGIKVKDKLLADAATKAGLRKYLPRRVDAGDVANSLEALVGEAWLLEKITLEEIVACLVLDEIDQSKGFVSLAQLALGRLGLGIQHDP